MKQHKTVTVEETLVFMSIYTMLAGFINSYTFFIRGGSFVSMHTGNFMRFGIFLYLQDFGEAMASFLPVVSCILGAALGCYGKFKFSHFPLVKWQKSALIIQGVGLIIVGFAPLTVPNMLVNASLSLITGFQLNNFRHYEGAIHNSTIATGNMRTYGQHLATLCIHRDKASLVKIARYSLVFFSFPVGAVLGGFASDLFSIRAVWVAVLFIIPLVAMLIQGEKVSQK